MGGHIRTLSIITFSVAMLAPAAPVHAATSSAEFHQACDRQLSSLEAEARKSVSDWQKSADAALARRDVKEAGKALEMSSMLTANVAGYTGGLYVKCLGESTYRSYLETRHKLNQLMARQDPGNARFVIQAALFDAMNNPGQDAGSVLSSIPLEPRAYRTAMDTSEANLQIIEIYQDNGAFILPEEETLAKISKKVIDRVMAEAQKQVRTALANEDAEFKRPATEQEKAATANMSGAGEMAMAMAGVDISDDASPQLIALNRQVSNSREWLRTANAWEFESGEKRQSFVRAEERGDTLLMRANDKSLDLPMRDNLYDHAERYYEWCDCDDKAARAERRHDEIQPALQAREDRRRQQLEKARIEMEQKAQDMKQATDNMKKSEAEKQQFKKEADELEEELGF